jgi:hypothetical protein
MPAFRHISSSQTPIHDRGNEPAVSALELVRGEKATEQPLGHMSGFISFSHIKRISLLFCGGVGTGVHT